MELKTLKDIETLDMKERAFANSIRKEAIKWIKRIEPKEKITNDIDITTIEDAANFATKMILTKETDIVVRWIKNFFNITEEELK